MSRCQRLTMAGILSLFVLALSAGQAQQSSQGGLTTVDNPGGGQFVFGPLTGQASKANALVYMLHLTHTHFGDKPVIGKLLQSKDGTSLATFFTLNAKTMGGRPIAGLVIISMQSQRDAQAAVLYDDAGNFVNSEPAMMKSLNAAWQHTLVGAAGGAQNNATAAHPASVGPMHIATGGDRSAMVRMPDSWRITGVSGGQLVAEGDRGEMISMGMIYQNVLNPQSQMGQRLMSGPMASRGPKVICPLSPDLFMDYVCVVNQVRRNNGKSQGTFNLTSSRPEPGSGGGARPILVNFTVDFNDGQGLRNGSARLGFMGMPNPQAGSYAISVSASNIPQKYGTATDPTLKAVVESYSQDASVIAREGAADLARIHQQGLANEAQADAINKRREASSQSFDNHMQQLKQNDAVNDQHNADLDWQSKINQNYILDRSVIRDSADTAHGTFGNNLADALVKSNPNQLEYVPNQQLVRGVDY